MSTFIQGLMAGWIVAILPSLIVFAVLCGRAPMLPDLRSANKSR